jgi:hypothetical protein
MLPSMSLLLQEGKSSLLTKNSIIKITMIGDHFSRDKKNWSHLTNTQEDPAQKSDEAKVVFSVTR